MKKRYDGSLEECFRGRDDMEVRLKELKKRKDVKIEETGWFQSRWGWSHHIVYRINKEETKNEIKN